MCTPDVDPDGEPERGASWRCPTALAQAQVECALGGQDLGPTFVVARVSLLHLTRAGVLVCSPDR